MQKGLAYAGASGTRRREVEDEVVAELLADDGIDEAFIERQFPGSEDREPEAKKRKLNRTEVSTSESPQDSILSHDQDQDVQTSSSSPSSSGGRQENDEILHDESQQSVESSNPHAIDAGAVERALGTTSTPTTATPTQTDSLTDHDDSEDVVVYATRVDATEAWLARSGIRKDGDVFSTTISIDGKSCTRYLHLDEFSSLVLKNLQAKTKRDVRDEVLKLGLVVAWDGGFLRKLDDVTLLQKSTEQAAAFKKIELNPDHGYLMDKKQPFSREWKETRALSELYNNWKRPLFNRDLTAERDETGKIIPLDTTTHYTRLSVDTGNTDDIETEIQRLHVIIQRLFNDPRHFQRKRAAYEQRFSLFFEGVKTHHRELSAIRQELLDAKWAVIERQRREEELRVARIHGCHICGNPTHQQRRCPENPRNAVHGRGGGALARGGDDGRGGIFDGPRGRDGGRGGPTSTENQGTLGGQAVAQVGTSMHGNNIIPGCTRGRGGGQGRPNGIRHQGTHTGQGTTAARTVAQGNNSISAPRGGQAQVRGGTNNGGHQGSHRGNPVPQASTSTRIGDSISTVRGGPGGGRGGGRGRGQQGSRGGNGGTVVWRLANGY